MEIKRGKKMTQKRKTIKLANVETIKKTLFIKDRIAVEGLLPKEGNIITMTLAKDIRSKVGLTQAELTKYKFKVANNGGLQWTGETKPSAFTFTHAEIELMKTQITELDNQNKISVDSLDICIMMRE